MSGKTCPECGLPFGYAFDTKTNRYKDGQCHASLHLGDRECMVRTIARLRSEVANLKAMNEHLAVGCALLVESTEGSESWRDWTRLARWMGEHKAASPAKEPTDG